MNYQELIEKALKGRSTYAMSKHWGIGQMTLSRYIKGERLPDYDTALKIAKEAGIEPGDAFETLAAEERMRKARQLSAQSGFVQTDLLLIVATCGLAALYFILCQIQCVGGRYF